MIWVTADHHFGHKNIIQYCNRPFKTTDEMDYTLIEKHNRKVRPNDTVYHLGDFALYATPQIYLDKLNGRFIFVKGNHDKNKFFNDMPTLLRVDKWGEHIYMAHHAHNIDGFDGLRLCGHVHEKWIINNMGVVNVGVDVWGFEPVSLAWLVKQYKKGATNVS